MSADNLDLSRVQRPVWDMERRYGETRNPDSMRFSLLINRMVFTPRKDPPRPPSVLAADSSQEVSDTSPRKRLSGHLCSRPLKPALFSPRKLVSPDLWSMPHAEPKGNRSLAFPPSLRPQLPAYHPLTLSTRNGAQEQGPRVRDEKLPSVYSS